MPQYEDELQAFLGVVTLDINGGLYLAGLDSASAHITLPTTSIVELERLAKIELYDVLKKKFSGELYFELSCERVIGNNVIFNVGRIDNDKWNKRRPTNGV